MKTKQADFRLFKREVEYWIDFWHLREWDINIVHTEHDVLKDMTAWCHVDWSGRNGRIGLCPDWGKDKVTHYDICKSAFHEGCELLLADVGVIGEIDAPRSQKHELTRSLHAVIRRMEYRIFKPNYDKRHG